MLSDVPSPPPCTNSHRALSITLSTPGAEADITHELLGGCAEICSIVDNDLIPLLSHVDVLEADFCHCLLYQ